MSARNQYLKKAQAIQRAYILRDGQCPYTLAQLIEQARRDAHYIDACVDR